MGITVYINNIKSDRPIQREGHFFVNIIPELKVQRGVVSVLEFPVRRLFETTKMILSLFINRYMIISY